MNLDAEEWASWVLMGDPYCRVPPVLEPIAKRIRQAVREAIAQNKTSSREEGVDTSPVGR